MFLLKTNKRVSLSPLFLLISTRNTLIIIISNKIPQEEAYAFSWKNRSPPGLRNPYQHLNSLCTSPSHNGQAQCNLLQRFEELCIIITKLSKQYYCTTTLVLRSGTVPPTEQRVLSANTYTILSQLEITLSMCRTCESLYPSFLIISSSLFSEDRDILIHSRKLCSTRVWKTLAFPSTQQQRNTTIRFISGIELFFSSYLLSTLHTSWTGFLSPSIHTQPSIIHQATYTESRSTPT